MKINHRTALSTAKILLVPYEPLHVPTYHTWMLDDALQRATASEPLSLEEEYAMQKSWREDGDKLTFIACLPLSSSSLQSKSEEGTKSQNTQDEIVQATLHDAPERMIGDINLFLYPFLSDDEDENNDIDDSSSSSKDLVGEIELMIARRNLHRQGYGRAALLAFIDYVLISWKEIAQAYFEHSDDDRVGENESKGNASGRLVYLRVKINASNESSVRLFESVSFVRTAAGENYFGEVELRWEIDSSRQLEGRNQSNEGGGGCGGSAASLKAAVERWRRNQGWEEVKVKRYVNTD
jgi:RimJ/RimL family protein N-acetyltransferase